MPFSALMNSSQPRGRVDRKEKKHQGDAKLAAQILAANASCGKLCILCRSTWTRLDCWRSESVWDGLNDFPEPTIQSSPVRPSIRVAFTTTSHLQLPVSPARRLKLRLFLLHSCGLMDMWKPAYSSALFSSEGADWSADTPTDAVFVLRCWNCAAILNCNLSPLWHHHSTFDTYIVWINISPALHAFRKPKWAWFSLLPETASVHHYYNLLHHYLLFTALK